MSQTRTHLQAVAATFVLATMPAPAAAETTEARLRRGDVVVRHLNGGPSQPTVERMKQEFPFLAEATQAYALGDVWSRPGLDDRTRQLAAVAAFAAMGEAGFMKIHAGYALNIGATEDELKEVIYMVTVPAGFPRAIAASQSLSDLFAERRASQKNFEARDHAMIYGALVTSALLSIAFSVPSEKVLLKMSNAPKTNASSEVMQTHPYVGMWVTADGRIRHNLLPNGRYDEARGRRESATRGDTRFGATISTTGTILASPPMATSSTGCSTMPA